MILIYGRKRIKNNSKKKKRMNKEEDQLMLFENECVCNGSSEYIDYVLPISSSLFLIILILL